MLIVGGISDRLSAFVESMQKMSTEGKDVSSNQRKYTKELEEVVYAAIRNVQIVIPAGGIIVATSTGPATNVLPVTSFIIT